MASAGITHGLYSAASSDGIWTSKIASVQLIELGASLSTWPLCPWGCSGLPAGYMATDFLEFQEHADESCRSLRPSFRICSAIFPWHSIGQRNHRVNPDSKGGWIDSSSYREEWQRISIISLIHHSCIHSTLGRRISTRNRRHIYTKEGRFKKKKKNPTMQFSVSLKVREKVSGKGIS